MKIRMISALVALAILLSLYFFLETTGLYIISFIVVSLCAFEFLQMTLVKIQASLFIHIGFLLSLLTVYLSFVFLPSHAISIFCIISILFLTSLLFSAGQTIKLSRITLKQGIGVLGFLYCGVFPALATRFLQIQGGELWLFSLLAFVFAGDTFAYLVGKKWGRRKLFEKISPKKTIEGSIGGIIGSGIFGLLASHFFFEGKNMILIFLAALLTGGFAQIGDLFESLLKRVAQVKDSGKIMPGHGGLLDRLDGVYFGAPILYTFITYFHL